MSDRYEILDILTQDADGVAFHAEDRETGTEVVLRRFFPFGADGGGLVGEEKTAYEIAVRRLMGVNHPALRNVLNGGTDPVDGMPFLVTEWLGGSPLINRLQKKPLSPQSAKALLDLALEACEVLSETFQEESIWIETATSSILLNGIDPERQVTFRISPLRWLGEKADRKGMRTLLRLGEEATGWTRRMLSDGSGDGLGGWIKELRKDPDQWTLKQARYGLHYGVDALESTPRSAVRAAPISPANATIPAQVAAPVLESKQATNWWPWTVAGFLTIVTISFIFWQVHRQRTAVEPPIAVESDPGPKTVGKETPPATAPTESGNGRVASVNLMAEEMAKEAASRPEITFGEEDTRSGKVIRYESSRSGKSYYLLFEEADTGHQFWAVFRRSDWKGYDPGSLQEIVGKDCRFSGIWKAENSKRGPVLRMKTREQLEVLN